MKSIVSIITPTYNHEQFIKTCIASVREQSMVDWEMIIIDDTSTDNTYKIAKEFADIDTRIQIIRHSGRWGISKLKKTYNQALSRCKSTYVAVLEGDDYWPHNKLEKQLKAIKNDNIVLSYGDCIFVDYKNRPLYVDKQRGNFKSMRNEPRGSIVSLFGSLKFHIIPVTMLINRKILNHIGGFQSSAQYPFIDIPTILALSLEGRFQYCKNNLGFYRKHKSSSWYDTVQMNPRKYVDNKLRCINVFIKKHKLKLDGLGVDTNVLCNIQNANIKKLSQDSHFFQLKYSIIHHCSDQQIRNNSIECYRSSTNIRNKSFALISFFFPNIMKVMILIIGRIKYYIYSFQS